MFVQILDMVKNNKNNWFEYSIAPPEEIDRLYHQDKLSTVNIADIYDTSTSRVYLFMRRYGINIRDKSKALKGNKNCRGRVISNNTRNKISNSNKGKKFSKEHKRKLSIAKKHNPPNNLVKEGQVEDNHPKWIKDRSKLKSNNRQTIMTSHKYKKWRKEVYERDNYTCQLCGDKSGGNLEAHHIKPYSLYPELVYELTNGLTLCKRCHRKLHKKNPIQYKCKNDLR